MAKAEKKLTRERFRKATFSRDGYQCVLCRLEEPHVLPLSRSALNSPVLLTTLAGLLDAHHITDRNEMPNGGYVKANGITVCQEHHEAVEAGVPSAAELYSWIGSSFEEAEAASWRLKP